MGKRVTVWLLGVVLLLALLPADLAAQERRITGRVIRAGSDEPVPGATVVVVGGPRAEPVLTNNDGHFTLNVPGGEVRLAVHAFGYVRMEVMLGAGQSTVEVGLQQDIFRLDELVVTGQATTIERRSATTSVAYVSGEELSKVSSPSVLTAMTGKISGVNLQSNSGAPGGAVQIQIRGNSTILGAFDPLFVVDGVIYSNASIPSGRRLTNSGTAGGEDDAVNRVADINPADIASIEVLKGAAASSIYGSKAANGVVVITTNRGQTGAPRINIRQGIGFSAPLRLMESRVWTEDSAVARWGDGVRQYFQGNAAPYFDHSKAVYNNRRPSHETSANVTGGTDATRYFISGTIKKDQGIERNTGAGRQSLRVNLDQIFSPKIDVRLTSVYNRSENDQGWNNNCNSNGCHGYAMSYIPSFVDISKRGEDGSYINPSFVGVQSNPVQLTELGVNHEETNRFTGGMTLGWNAFESGQQNLRVVVGGGIDVFQQSNNVWTPNELYFEQPRAEPGTKVEGGGRSLFYNWNVNAIHNWNGSSWSASTSFGLQYEDQRLHTHQILTRNLLPGQQNVNRGTNITASENLVQDRTIALYASEALQFLDDRLRFEAGFRAERSSTNGDIDKYFVYPKVSTSYRFLDLVGQGSEVKLRAAYGETGNLPLFGHKFTNLNTPQFGGQRGLTISTTSGLSSVEPERKKEIEFGVDGNGLNGRLTWELTAFTHNTTNLLLQRVPAPSSGFSSQIFNGGKIRNSGVEVGLGFTPVQSGSTLWVVRGTFTRYTSEVVDLAGLPPFFPPSSGFGAALGTTYIEEGMPITQIAGFGLKPDSTRADKISMLGNSAPDFRVGLVNDLTFGPFNIGAVVDWQQGGTIINLTRYLQDHGKTSADWGTPEWEKRYKMRLAGTTLAYLEDASFLKVREVNVDYQVPSRFVDALMLGARDVSLGLAARNLFMWTKYSGLDPEVANFGAAAIRGNLDIAPYPPSRSFFFNISVGF